jgi:hypothetical protein
MLFFQYSRTRTYLHVGSLTLSFREVMNSEVLADCRLRLKRDGTRAETRFSLSTKRTIPFKSEWASVQSTTGSRNVRINCSNAGYTMFRGSVKCTGYSLHSIVFPSLSLPCVTVCHYISTGLYHLLFLYTALVTGQ